MCMLLFPSRQMTPLFGGPIFIVLLSIPPWQTMKNKKKHEQNTHIALLEIMPFFPFILLNQGLQCAGSRSW